MVQSAITCLHGLADDAAGVSNLGEQLQSAAVLAHVKYIFPNAPEDRDMMSTAWYIQTKLTPAPPSRPQLADDENEDGLLAGVRYVEGLVDERVEAGVPASRAVVGGFGQGMAVSLLFGLLSERYAGQIGGILAVCGYLPLEEGIEGLRKERGLAEKGAGVTKVLLMRGKADVLVPSRYSRMAKDMLVKCGNVEGEEGSLVSKEYEGVGHSINGAIMRDMSEWLARVLPQWVGDQVIR